MDDLKKGDIIRNEAGTVREEILAVLEDLYFSRVIYDDCTKSTAMGPQLIEDGIKNGFKKEGQ